MARNDAQDGSPWTQRGFLLAAGLIAIIVVLGAVVVLAGGGDDGGTSAAQREAPAPSSNAERSRGDRGGGESACGLSSGDAAIPTGGLPGTQWELVGTMAAPTAPQTHGPGQAADGFRTCFARTPVGALYAAVNFWAAGTARPSSEVIEALAANTRLKEQAIEDAREQEAAGAGPLAAGLQVAGYNFISYDDSSAAIDLAFRTDNGALLRLPTALRWEDGDWRYVIPPKGDPGGTQIRDLSGFVEWRGA